MLVISAIESLRQEDQILRPCCATLRVLGQPQLHSNTLSQNKSKNQKNNLLSLLSSSTLPLLLKFIDPRKWHNQTWQWVREKYVYHFIYFSLCFNDSKIKIYNFLFNLCLCPMTTGMQSWVQRWELESLFIIHCYSITWLSMSIFCTWNQFAIKKKNPKLEISSLVPRLRKQMNKYFKIIK
jgi:hypothetical protein